MRNEAQLRDVFNSTFDALPPDVRSRIEDLWHRNGVSREDNGSGRFIPPIFREPTILNRTLHPRQVPPWVGPTSSASQIINAGQHAAEVFERSRGICGQTDGIVFRFKASVVDQAPDEMLKIVIAHELAHTYRAAEVGLPFPEAALALGTSEDEEEQAAIALQAEWGFEQGPLLQWLQANEAALGI
jgi:hypothetical protein